MAVQKIKLVGENAHKEYTYNDIRELAKESKTKSRLAIMLRVHRNTIKNTMDADKEFCAAVEEGFAEATRPIVEAMYKYAEKGDSGLIKYIINNRESEEWADKTKVEQTVELKGNVLDKLDESYESNG